MNGHSWHFVVSSPPTIAGRLVAVCDQCGTIRTSTLPAEGGGKIDLSGECEAAPLSTADIDPIFNPLRS